MIFVILGLFILLVSFLIALITMIREQRALEAQTQEKEAEIAESPSETKSTSEETSDFLARLAQLSRDNELPKAADVDIERVENEETRVSHEPFFWERAASEPQETSTSELKQESSNLSGQISLADITKKDKE